MNKFEDLLERAKWGTFHDEELDYVVKELQNSSEQDQYTLLHILGRGGEQSLYRGGNISHLTKYVEPFLQSSEDLLVRLALWILCLWWDLCANYLTEILRLLQYKDGGLEDARRSAILIAGNYLKDKASPEMLRELIRIYEDIHEEHTKRQYAYFALAEALGKEMSQLPPVYVDIPLEPPPDPSVLPGAVKRLLKELA